ncbi:MAG: tripartite tricarboxylate transporter substrate binding protein [Burkholderiales bacterium]|nr:tripartite tricarboxylate transporter substrate binding protein [Burkholderiales bacterium]
MKRMRALIHRSTAATLVVACAATSAWPQARGGDPAQGYPNKPIRWIIDFGAGGLSDTLARTVAQKLTEAWSQPIVNDARPGANGTIAYDLGSKAPPDGYTLIFLSTPFSINVSIYTKLPYDTRKDFAAISLIALYPNILVANLKLPAKSVSELIAYAKAKPGGPTWATVGVGSSPFLATDLFRRQAGFDGIHVPYNASPVALTDLMGGRIEFMFVNMPTAIPLIQSGKIRALGIASPSRSNLLPDLPTIAESGVAGFQSVGYTGAAVPAKTPRAIIDKLNAEMVRALKMPDVQERIKSLGGEPRWSTPREFTQFLEDEIARWAPVARATGVKLER